MKKTALLLVMIVFAVFVLTACSGVAGLENFLVTLGVRDHMDEDNDHRCDFCEYRLTSCADADKNHFCDLCEKELSKCSDSDKNHNCDLCDKVLSECADDNKDHKCDYCGTELSKCTDADRNHKCEYCGKATSECAPALFSHKCGVCGKVFSECEAPEGSHFCKVCGALLTSCVDDNKDHRCDVCRATLSVCEDADKDHACDLCGTVISTCTDANDDNKCDICEKVICEHVDTDDHKCDLCEKVISVCADDNKDHNCDVCGTPLTSCADGNSDHLCDLCGKVVSECVDGNNDHLCDVCGKVLSECTDSDSDHRCDLCGGIASSCTDSDGNKQCDVCGAPFEDISYLLNISELETGTRAEDDINGKFVILSTTEVRTRTRTYEGTEYTKSVKIGSKTAGMKINVPGTGKLSFLIQNGSSGAATQFVVITAPDGTSEEIEFAGVDSGSPVVKIEIDVTEGEWTIARKSGTIDIFYLELSCSVPVSDECGFELVNAGKVDFICNTDLDLSSLKLNAVFENGKTDPLDLSLVTVDTSKVDMTKAGVYEVTVSYKEYAPITFEVKVYEPSELKLGFDATKQISSNSAGNSVYFNYSFKETYALGEELSLDGLSVTVVAKCGEETLEFSINDYTVSGFDSSTAGAKALTVAYEYEAGKSVSADVTVYVVGAEASVVDGVYMTKVDQAYTGEIGAVVDGYNVFTTVQQALDFLSKADSNAKKVIEIGAGKYTEKLEITIPNLTIKGAGADVTMIEWDSLYGIPDAGGFEQVTDSTASVAVRDTAVNCVIENITISNYWNSIEVFDKDLGAGYAEHRALALLVQADRFILRNSGLLGYQDTVEFFLGRQYVENCYIAGTTDFIFGTNNTTLFVNCEIHSIDNGKTDGGYITAFKGMNKGDADAVVYGAVFYGCKFTADEKVVANGNTAIGRTWGKYAAVALINCDIDAHVSTKVTNGSKNERYVSMNGIKLDEATLQFVEYGNTGAGAITEAVTGMRFLTAEEAALYSDIKVVFGKVNGKVTYLDAWDPNSTEIVEDDRTYYYFDQTVGTTGTPNTLPTDTKLDKGSTLEWAGILLNAEGGNIAWNSNANALNMKAGAYIKFTVEAGTEVIVSAYPNYQFFTVNGVGTSAATLSRYFAEATEVVIMSTGDCYLYSIIVNPGEEAPAAAELVDFKIEGFAPNYKVGEDIVLDGVIGKAYYSDNSFITVTDFTVDASAVNKDTAGEYAVIFAWGGKSVTATVTYEDPDAAAEITKNTVLDFSTQDGLAAVESNPRVTIEGSVRHNGGEIQIQGTISFPVKAGTLVKVNPYANTQYASFTIGKAGDEGLETLNTTALYLASEDCTVVYTGLSNNYLISIEIICPVTEGKYVFGKSTAEGDFTGVLESINNLVISGTCKTHSGGAQLAQDSVISFIVPAYTDVVIQGFDTNYGILEVLAGDTRVEIDANAQYVFSTTEATYVTIKAANVGTEEEPAYNKSYITSIDVDYGVVFSENTTVNFGSEGNYVDCGIDFSGANMRDNGGNNSQMSSGSFSFVIKKGATLLINGYPGYTSYTLSDGTTVTEEITADTYTYVAEADVLVTITAVNSNNYFYSFSVTYPAGGETPEEPVTNVYVLDFTLDLPAMAQGDKADGDTETVGTDGFFTMHYGAKNKIDGSNKNFDDGYSATQRYSMGGKTEFKTDYVKSAIEFTTQGTATVTIWWVSGGDGREMNLFAADGTILQTTEEGSTKNSLYISTFEISEAGTYLLGCSVNSNYFFKVEVQDTVG